MRHLKILALAAVAAGALMAFIGAGTVSATVLCSTTADPCPAGQPWTNNTEIDFSIKSGTTGLKDTSGNSLDTCTGSTIKGIVTNTGSSTETVTGTIAELNWTGCTFTTKTVTTGMKWKIHKEAGTSNGTITSDSQIEWTINTVLFGSCIYGVNTTEPIGTITEGIGTGSTFHANAVTRRLGSPPNVACPETSKWTGTYSLTFPTNTTLSVSESGS